MLERLIRLAALVTSGIVVASFVMFAVDQFRAASKHEQDRLAEIDQPAPSESTKRAREREHGEVRKVIEKADDFLLGPFTGIVDSKERWVRRGVPTALALLVYAFGLGFLARFLRTRY